MQAPRNSAFDSIVEQCIGVLRHAPAALLTDIDGTISPMARTPDEAVVLPKAKDALERLRHHLALVGIVTGRSATVGEALVGLPGLIYVGNHGMEWTEGGRLTPNEAATAWTDAVRASLIEISEHATARGIDEGLVVEDKGLSGSIHFRLAPDIAHTEAVLKSIAAEVTNRYGLRVTEGRMVLEIRPPVRISKGTALADLVRDRGIKGIVFLGDDVTDVDAFVAVRQAREQHGVRGLRIGILSAETPQSVLDESDVTLAGVASCADLLAAVADGLQREAPAPRQASLA
jgi:trehalose 6-phosphate phosphatase